MIVEVDGVPVRVATGGNSLDGDDPLVVLIHGAGMNRSVWFQQTRYLAFHGFRAVAVDLPGHGGTPGPVLDSVAAMADWLAALVRELGGPAHLVGHSMGALVALDTAAPHADLARSLVLVGVGATMPVHPELQGAAEANDDRADELVAAWSYGRRQHVGHNPAPGLWMIGGSVSLLHRAHDGVLANDLAACNAYLDAPERVGAVGCPITVVAGSVDRMTPLRRAEELMAIAPSAELVVLPGVGHMAMHEAPQAVREVLIGHLRAAEEAA